MPLLGSTLTSIFLGVTLVLASAVAGLMAYHYAMARFREKRGFDADPEPAGATPANAAEQRAKSAEEIAQIRARIEALMEQQNVRSETQSQHLAQKLDEIRTHMNTQDRKFDGLKSELRHEIRRRDGELDELRHQLASALDAFWKSMPALPSGEARALPPPAPAPTPDAAYEPEPTPDPPDWDVPFAEATPLDDRAPAFSFDDTAASFEGPYDDGVSTDEEPQPFERTPSFDEIPEAWEAEAEAEVQPFEEAPEAWATDAPPYDDAEAWEAPPITDDSFAPPPWSSPFAEIPLVDETEEPLEELLADENPFAEESPIAAVSPEPALHEEAEEADFTEGVTHEDAPLHELSLGDNAFEAFALGEDTPLSLSPVEGPGEAALAPSWEPLPPVRADWATPFTSGDGSPDGPPPAAPPHHAPVEEMQAPQEPPAPEPPPAVLEGDDLTVITGITPEIQQRLYAAGVTTLDEMARWSRADARRISGAIDVAEEIIMHQWIFEAQSVLFEQYQSMMTQGV